MLRKVTGIDSLVERVVERIGKQLEQVWILGSLAQGLDSKTIEVLLIGKDLDSMYIANLIQKTEDHIGKGIKCTISGQYF